MPFSFLLASGTGILLFVPIMFLPLKLFLRIVLQHSIELADSIKVVCVSSTAAAVLQVLLELMLAANGTTISDRGILAAVAFACMLISGTIVVVRTEGITLGKGVATGALMAFVWVGVRVGLVGEIAAWFWGQKF